MKNVTVTLEQEVARWARIRAAEKEMSLSRYLGELLREKMEAEERYEAAMDDYLSRSPRAIRRPGSEYPDREEIHDRAGLR